MYSYSSIFFLRPSKHGGHKIYDKGRLYDINMSFYLEKTQLSEFQKLKHMKIFFFCFFFSLGERFSLKTD